ncbi:MAG: cysteine desulfurase-like protein [Actinobacteria bacterium]|nr:cysteine desulfurase-like protein [Actinomycetota bacterium]
MSVDVARLRGLYPTLGAGLASLDGPFGALHPETVVRAIITTLRRSPVQPGSHSARSISAAASVASARAAVGDLLGATPDAVVLGADLATLLSRFAGLLAADWQLGDEVVLNRLDHDANIRPWMAAARAVGASVRWAEFDVETGELPDWQYDGLITRRTRLVSVPLANPVTGTVPDVRAVADRAHAVGALLLVDSGAALPHLPVDLAELGADLLGISAPVFGGPSVGAIVARPGLLAEMDSDIDDDIPERFELGALPVELLDGLTAAVDHLADLDEAATGSRRRRVLTSLQGIGEYEHDVYLYLDERVRALPRITVIGSSTDRVPVLALTVDGHTPAEVGEFLARRRVSVWTGRTGMSQLMKTVGVDELGGAVHLGLMPYVTTREVDQLIEALSALVGAR